MEQIYFGNTNYPGRLTIFNNLLSVINRTSRQKVRKYIEESNNTIKTLTTSHPKPAEYLKRFKMTESTQSVLNNQYLINI